MGSNAGPGSAGGSDEWVRELDWAFGLVSDDPLERAVALARFEMERQERRAIQQRFYEVCDLLRPLSGRELWEEPLFLDAHQALERAHFQVLPPRFIPWQDGDVRKWPGLTYLVLYLEWEARSPEEWTQRSKSWGLKQSLIRRLAVPDHDPSIRSRLLEVVMSAVVRAHRCEDGEYVHMARALDGPDLRTRLAEAADSENPWARLHAGYVLWMLDHPYTPNSRYTWETWCAMQR
jgi:hypothetical protein